MMSDKIPDIQEVTVHGYQPHAEQRPAHGVITIIGHFPDDDRYGHIPGESFADWEQRQADKFIVDAGNIYQILENDLPGGTMHQLLIRMLQGKVNLFVVQDVPNTTIADIARLACAFVWEPENWENYQATKGTSSAALPPEWSDLCHAVEQRFGPPVIVPDEDPLVEQTEEVREIIAAFERGNVVEDEERRRVTAVRPSIDVPGCVLIQVNQDDAEWYLVQPSELTATPF